MRKLTLFIEEDSEKEQLDENLMVMGNNPYLVVKTMTVYWKYNNVITGFYYRFTGYQGRVTLEEGYWTFQKLADKLKKEKVTLEGIRVNGKCRSNVTIHLSS